MNRIRAPRRLTAIAVAGALLIAACGGSDGSVTTTSTNIEGGNLGLASVDELLDPGLVVEPIELPAEIATFLDDLQRAIQSADRDFLLDHLHPAVIAQYGYDRCEERFAAISVRTLEILPTAISGPEQWIMALDDIDTLIVDSYELEVVFREDGSQSASVFHIAEADGMFRWFTDCGQPLSVPGGPSQ